MQNRTFYNEILTEHNVSPYHKFTLKNAPFSHRGVNPSCGDDITLWLDIDENDIIRDGSFNGDGCAISQASADIMLDLIIGKSIDEAITLKNTFLKMIKDSITDEEYELLEEAVALSDIAHMPSRVKCAVLGWHTLEEMVNERNQSLNK